MKLRELYHQLSLWEFVKMFNPFWRVRGHLLIMRPGWERGHFVMKSLNRWGKKQYKKRMRKSMLRRVK